jgi:hypothetical protein
VAQGIVGAAECAVEGDLGALEDAVRRAAQCCMETHVGVSRMPGWGRLLGINNISPGRFLN